MATLGGLLAAAAPAAALERGQTEFWTGGAACGDRCWEHHLDLGAEGWRLRVALDRHAIAGGWTAQVTGPDGGGTIEVPTGLYSGETFVDRPDGGRWTVRVTAEPDTKDLRFRMRAKLEHEPLAPAVPVSELPNLQALPPWDLTFAFPVTNGTTDPPQSLSTPGERIGCHPEEQPAVRCLRMAFGVRNTGRGPMDLFLGPGSGTEDRPLIQRIYNSDGSTADRDAGLARFHISHAHYHHSHAIGLSLLAVTDPAKGTMTTAAAEHRKGFAHRDELLREWRRFYPVFDKDGFGLLPGWGDYYEWDRPGNYVDFGVNGDGRYVLRLVADPVDGIVETNDRDNTAYTYIEVAGTTVRLLESGRGTDPWDRCKILIPLGAEPELPRGQRQPRRPRDCPRDG